MTHTAPAVLACAFAAAACSSTATLSSVRDGRTSQPAATSDGNGGSAGGSTGSGSGDAAGGGDGSQSEDAKADQPAQVTGMFLACDESEGVDESGSSVAMGCAPVNGDGARMTVAGQAWSVAKTDGSAVTFTVMPSDLPDWDAYLVMDKTLLGAVSITDASEQAEQAASYQSFTPPPMPAAVDATQGVLCAGGFASLPIETGPGACPDGAVVVTAKDGWDLRYSCCSLPEPAALSSDPTARNVARDGACNPGEVQTGFADALRPLCTAIDSTNFEMLTATPAVYVSKKVGVGTKGAGEKSDIDGYLASAKRTDVCLCPDLRMAFAGGHVGKSGSCQDQCVLIQAKGESDPLGSIVQAATEAAAEDSTEGGFPQALGKNAADE